MTTLNLIGNTDAMKMIKLASPMNTSMSLSSMKSPTQNTSLTQALTLPIGANLIDLGKKLLDASRLGDTEDVKALMQNGAPFTTDWLGTSALHFAAQYGHAETADVLLRAGISRDARTKVDRTPLHIAAQEGHLGIVSTLIEHGADVDARDMLKMTPLHWCVERGHIDVVECLLSNGADVNITSKFEKTPLDVAIDNGRLDLVPLLQKYVGVNRPKPDVKPTSIPSVKMRPTVLPNKNRTSKSSKSQHQMKSISHQNLNNWQKSFNFEHLKKIFSGFGDSNLTPEDLNSAASSHPVLATLAALANVASSSSSQLTNPADVLQWLENHGNWSNNNTHNESQVVQSAIESGQTISLTEAGKLALNWGKEESDVSASASGSSSASTTTPSSSNKNNCGPNKVITIVSATDKTQLPHIISNTQTTPIVLVSGSSPSTSQSSINLPNTSTRLTRKSPIKITKLSDQVNVHLKQENEPHQKFIICNSSNSQTASHLLEIEKLKKELSASKKQAEEYKSKLELKEREVLRYKKECEHLRAIKVIKK